MNQIEATDNLHPVFLLKLRPAMREAAAELGAIVVEGFRSAERQAALYAKGRTVPGKIITRAVAWRSMHQYGLAVDMAFKVNRLITWEGPWDELDKIFEHYGLSSLKPYERAHYEWRPTHFSFPRSEEFIKRHGYDKWLSLALDGSELV